MLTINGGTLTVGDVTLTSASVLNIGLAAITRGSQYGRAYRQRICERGRTSCGFFEKFPASSRRLVRYSRLGQSQRDVCNRPTPWWRDNLGYSQLYVNGVVTVGSILIGDYNLDGAVDAADYVVWRVALDSTTNLAADGNENGVIDTGDYDVWRSHFGQTGNGLLAGHSVPEPSTLIVAVLFGLIVSSMLFSKWPRDRSATLDARRKVKLFLDV